MSAPPLFVALLGGAAALLLLPLAHPAPPPAACRLEDGRVAVVPRDAAVPLPGGGWIVVEPGRRPVVARWCQE